MRIVERFEFGSKKLTLVQFSTDISTNVFQVIVDTIQNRNRIEGETTQVFQKTQTYLQKRADDEKAEMSLLLVTENEKLMLWAEKVALWKWDEFTSYPWKSLRAVVKFRPSQ